MNDDDEDVDIFEEGASKSKSWNPFKKNLGEIPCFRKAFLTGITSGLGCGLGYFFFSSNARKSTHVGFGSYIVLTTATWFYCRYQWSADRFRNQRLKIMDRPRILESTELESKKEAEIKTI